MKEQSKLKTWTANRLEKKKGDLWAESSSASYTPIALCYRYAGKKNKMGWTLACRGRGWKPPRHECTHIVLRNGNCYIKVLIRLMCLISRQRSAETSRGGGTVQKFRSSQQKTQSHQMFSSDFSYKTGSRVRSCVKIELAILGSLPLTVLMISIDVKQQWTWVFKVKVLYKFLTSEYNRLIDLSLLAR